LENEYKLDVKINSFDADALKRLTISGQLRYQQEVGDRAINRFGATYEKMAEAGMFFVLIKTSSRIYRHPKLSESCILKTWHQGINGVRFIRRYNFIGLDGEPLIDSVTVFALIDNNRQILRPKEFDKFNLPPPSESENGAEIPKKIVINENLPSNTIQKTVHFSDLDYNMHMNNTIYGNVIMDALPKSHAEKDIDSFAIEFKKEAIFGDNFEAIAYYNEKTAYIKGGERFSAKINFL